jgi:hypothetical protein
MLLRAESSKGVGRRLSKSLMKSTGARGKAETLQPAHRPSFLSQIEALATT